MAKKKAKAAKKKANAAKKKAPAKKAKAAKPSPIRHGTLCHVDLVTPDLEQGQKTLTALFGWQFHPMAPGSSYFVAGPGGMPGGSFDQGTPAPGGPLVYVNVDDIHATLAKAESLGGTTLKPRTEIGGGHGFCAAVRLPDGNVFGLYNQG
jgi:uncharacterized protein